MKSNALRSKSRKKRKEIETEGNNIDSLQKKLKLSDYKHGLFRF